MLRLRLNSRHAQEVVFCPLCSSPPLPGNEQFEDSQEHLLQCVSLSSPTDVANNDSKYTDIFSENKEKMEYITLLPEQKYKIRQKLQQS